MEAILPNFAKQRVGGLSSPRKTENAEVVTGTVERPIELAHDSGLISAPASHGLSGIVGIFDRNPGRLGNSDLLPVCHLLRSPGLPPDRTIVRERVALLALGREDSLIEGGAPERLMAATGEMRCTNGLGFAGLFDHLRAGATPDFRALNGAFAFACYDDDRGTLILGRDPVGLKPLYFCCLPDRVVFASAIKLLLPLLPRQAQIHPQALAQFVQNSFSGGGKTALCGIERVLPGEVIRIGGDLRLSRQRYWSLANAPSISMADSGLEQAGQALDPLFDQVLREHLSSADSCGLLLSGGVDSGVLCALLANLQAAPLQTFSVGYDLPTKYDELADARRIAMFFGTRHNELHLTYRELLRRIPYMVWCVDELMDDPASLPTSLAADHIGKCVRTVFTGEGADEVFAGDGTFRRSAFQRWLTNLMAPGSGGFRTRGLWSPGTRRKILATDLMRASADNRHDFIAAWQSAPGNWSAMQRAQLLELSVFAPNSLVPKVERPLSQAGLDVRLPFLDPRIVSFGLALPDRLKVHDRHGKYVLRQWAARRLPLDHVMKKKRGFQIPITTLLSGKFLNRLEPALLASRAIREWFRPDAIKELIASQRQHRNAGKPLWRLMYFAIWHTLFVECPSALPTLDEDPIDWIH